MSFNEMEVLYLAYAVYGFTFAFISLAVQYELVNTFKYNASSLAFAWSCISAPWTLKPLYGYISDKAGRRICISTGAFAAAILLLILAQSNSNQVVFLMMISLSICFADVASDSIVVTRTKTHGKAVQTNCWSARTFGSMIGTGLCGLSYEWMGYANVLRVACIGPFLLAVMIWEIEEPVIVKSSVKLALKSVYNMRKIILIAVFFGLMPEIGNALFPTIKEKLDPVEISLVSVTGSFTACVIDFFYQYTNNLFETPLKVAVVLSMLAGILAFWTYTGSTPLASEICRSIIGGIDGMLFVLPMVTRAAELSSDGSEGVSYALFVSIMNLSGVLGELLEGAIITWIGDMGVFLICATVWSWLPLLVI